MLQVPLKDLVQTVSPKWLHLLKEEEQSQWVVLRNGMERLSEEDVAEIVEAVIIAHQRPRFYH